MDISYDTHEGHFHVSARAVILRDGHILMVKAQQRYYTVGGRVQFDESAEQAIEREALEETGAAFEVDRLLFVHEEFVEKGHLIALTFLMKPNDAPICEHTDNDEELVWVPIESLRDCNVYPSFLPGELPRLSNEIKHFVTRE